MTVPTAPCGIECGSCPIFKAAQDAQAAERLAETWKRHGYESAESEWFKCQGCYGDPKVRWTSDCAIRKCCVDERALTSCSRCRDFPCEKLEAWACEAHHHEAALARLKAVRAAAEAPSLSR